MPHLGEGCSLIGVLQSSILEVDVLVGVTVLFGVGSMSPIMGVRGEALQRVKRPFPEGMGNSLLAVISTRRPSQDSVSANAELMPEPSPYENLNRQQTQPRFRAAPA